MPRRKSTPSMPAEQPMQAAIHQSTQATQRTIRQSAQAAHNAGQQMEMMIQRSAETFRDLAQKTAQTYGEAARRTADTFDEFGRRMARSHPLTAAAAPRTDESVMGMPISIDDAVFLATSPLRIMNFWTQAWLNVARQSFQTM